MIKDDLVMVQVEYPDTEIIVIAKARAIGTPGIARIGKTADIDAKRFFNGRFT